MELEQSPTDANAADKQHSSNEQPKYQFHPVEGTPFTIVQQEEEFHLLMGKYRLNVNPFKTFEEALADTQNATWNRIVMIMQILIKENQEQIQLNATIEKQKATLNQN